MIAGTMEVNEKVVHILVVVEDEPDMRLVIKMTLAADRHLHIDGEAASASEAIELARTLEPGLIILDHQIEGDVMGLEAAQALKEAAPQAKILLFTAFDLKAEAAASPHIDEYLSKSELPKLLPTVRRLVGLD